MFTSLAASVIDDLIAQGRLPRNPTVVDMGSQTLDVSRPQLLKIIARLRASASANRHDAGIAWLESHLDLERRNGRPSVREFYRALGFSLYDAIDINSRANTIAIDLNQDVSKEYGFVKRYDLVVNNGTSEHVFDQATFLRNAHNLANSTGYMVHMVPFTGYFNHGFYGYQPGLFLDLAAANSYTVDRLLLGDREGILLDFMGSESLITDYRHLLGLTTRNPKNNTLMVAVLRKSSASEFVLPCQGKYVDFIGSREIQKTYERQPLGASAEARSRWTKRAPRTWSPVARLRRSLKTHLLLALRGLSRFVLLRL